MFVLALGLLGACSSTDEPGSEGTPARDVQADRLLDLARTGDGQPRLDVAPARLEASAKPEAAGPYVHQEVSPSQVKAWIDAAKAETLVDVREPSEFAGGHLAGALNLAWTSGVLKASYATLPSGKPIVIYCQSGNRSHQAATFLAGKGLTPVYDMQGGIGAWTGAGYPTVK